MKTLTVCNQKGGVGKSTTAQALAEGLANRSKKVLLIDADGQANLTETFAPDVEFEKDFYEFNYEHHLDARLSYSAQIDLIPASDDGTADFLSEVSKEDKLLQNKHIKDSLVRYSNDYDYVVIDAPPTLDQRLTNALVASDFVLVPVTPDAYSKQGLTQLLFTVAATRKLNPSLKILGIFINKFKRNVTLDSEVVREINRIANQYHFPLLQTVVRESTRVKRAQWEHTPFYACLSKNPAAQDFNRLIDELIQKGF